MLFIFFHNSIEMFVDKEIPMNMKQSEDNKIKKISIKNLYPNIPNSHASLFQMKFKIISITNHSGNFLHESKYSYWTWPILYPAKLYTCKLCVALRHDSIAVWCVRLHTLEFSISIFVLSCFGVIE